MSRNATRRKPSKTRVVSYVFENDHSFSYPFDVEARLRKAWRDGVITTWDDGRGSAPWFQGPPGPAIRALRDEFLKAGGIILPDDKRVGLTAMIKANRWKMT